MSQIGSYSRALWGECSVASIKRIIRSSVGLSPGRGEFERQGGDFLTFPSLLEPHTRHTVGSVTPERNFGELFCLPETHPIQVILHVPEVAPQQACQLVHRFPPTTEGFKPSRALQTKRRPQGSDDIRTTACQRLVLPVPAHGPRGGRRPGRSPC